MTDFPRVQERSALASREAVLARPSPVPNEPGVYAWYFAEPPPGIDTEGCYEVDGLTLLYVGISPKEPPTNGRAPSRSTLRKRLQTHYRGNAEGSTLRKTLGCLLSDRLGYPLRRVGSGTRYTFTNPGEQALDNWMAANAFVVWKVTEKPWELERQLLSSGLALPLNIKDNPCEAHVEHLRRVRRAAMARAVELDIVADSGGPRRRTTDLQL